MNNWAEENTAEPLKDYENRVQLTSVIVRTKGANKQVQYSYPNMLYIYKMFPKSTQPESKCWYEKDQVSKIANLPKTLNDLGWHSCLSKVHLTKYDLDSLI